MSGIVGIINRNDVPCDRELVQELTNFLSFRGPDAQNVWTEGQAAFGHALLRTTPETVDEKQPCTLDGRVWITAEARLDDAQGLRDRLAQKGSLFSEADSHARLILGAYRQWGDECLQYLAGDFAFAIWDQRHRRLFCARDHFGVRPFFYGVFGETLVFSNTLACLRRHPGASRKLDDEFMADFLLFNRSLDAATTAFTNLRRLPGAHYLTWDASGLRIERYWQMPMAHDAIRFSHPQEYVDEFRRLLRLAIRDRVRTSEAAVFMSGGLDSTTLAAASKSYLKDEFGRSSLTACVQVFSHLMDDSESIWAPKAAAGIDIPLQIVEMDRYQPFAGWMDHESDPGPAGQYRPPRWGLQPEPANDALMEPLYDSHRQAASHSSVALTGNGPDSFLTWPVTYFFDLAWSGRFGQLFVEIFGHWKQYRKHPPLGLRWLVTESWKKPRPWTIYPGWLNHDFAGRMNMRERLQRCGELPSAAHQTRPAAHRSLSSLHWPVNFEYRDAGVTGVPLSVVHPYFDLRIINFCLSIPAVPWCVQKELLRQAAVGLVPDAVRFRPKTGFPKDPLVPIIQKLDRATLARYTLPESLDPYIRRDAVIPLDRLVGGEWSEEPRVDYRPFGLAYWLQQQTGSLTIT